MFSNDSTGIRSQRAAPLAVVWVLLLAGCLTDVANDRSVATEPIAGRDDTPAAAPASDKDATPDVTPESDEDAKPDVAPAKPAEEDDDFVVEVETFQDPRGSSAESDEEPAIELRLTTTEIAPYEPVRVVLLLTNRSDPPTTIFFGDEELYNVAVSFENGPYRNCRGFDDGPGCSWGMMGPNAVIWFDRLLFYRDHVKRADAIVFDRPGKYRLMAVGRHRLMAVGTETEPLEITVREPDASEAEATRVLTEPAFAAELQSPTWDNITVLEDFVEKYPRSVFTDHVRYAIGECFSGKRDELEYNLGEQNVKPIRERVVRTVSAITDRIPALRARAVLLLGGFFEVNLQDPEAYHKLRKEIDSIDPNAVCLDPRGVENVRFQTRYIGLLYFADPRLESEVIIVPDQSKLIGSIVELASRESEVALDCAPNLRTQMPMRNMRGTFKLRELMQHVAWPYGYWDQDGDGYRLIPSPNPRWEARQAQLEAAKARAAAEAAKKESTAE